MEFIDKKYKDSVITFDPDNIRDYKDLFELLKREMKPSIRYSILLRVSYLDEISGEHSQYKMLDDQLGFSYKFNKDLVQFSKDLYEVIYKRLEYSMDAYHYNGSDVITLQILLFTVGKSYVVKKVKINRDTFLNERSMVKNSSGIINNFKSFNLKDDRSNYGTLLEKFGDCECIKLLDGSLVKVNSILFRYNSSKIRLNEDTDFYQKGDSELIVVNTLNDVTYVSVYTLGGMHITDLEFEIIGKDDYVCKISNVKMFISKGEIYKKEIDLKFSPVYAQTESGRIKRMIQPEWRIGSLDLETYKFEGNSYTYAIGFCIKGELKTFYIKEDLDSEKLIIDCLNNMLTEKYNGYTFYSHNLTNYDIYFIFKVIVDNSDMYSYEPSFRDDRIIGIKISRKVTSKPLYKVDEKGNSKTIYEGGITKTYSIRIVDSCNMLQAKLSKLCKTFDTEIVKGHYPYDFVSKNKLFYIGNKPDIKYYNDLIGISSEDKLSLEEYNNIPLEGWDLKKETIKYLESDLLGLFQVMEEFNKKVYIDYHIHASKSLTISSLSMDIFLRRYYKDNIPLIKQKHIYTDIKESYYGGITEVYKPYGKDLFYYDVNSLYPYSALNPMPGKNCVYSDNISENFDVIGNNLFGFYYCKIKASELYVGLLPHRSNHGLTMPLGEFEGWYFSEELRYAHEKGYNINVIKGYTFDKVYGVFDEYIKHLYSIKCTTKSDVERQIVKSLLNNLLGRFGLDINKYVTSIVNDEEFKDLIQTRKVRGVKFMDDKVLLSYEESLNKRICEEHSLDFRDIMKKSSTKPNNSFTEGDHHDVSVAISSAVTAYSRVFMNKIKMDILTKGGNIYYTDTDSIVSDIELDTHLIGNELGQFKLEHKILEGYFVSSKTYAFKTVSGKLVTKNKGVYKDTLNLEQFKDLYSSKVVEAYRYTTKRDFVGGSALIHIPKTIKLNPSSYRKRVKVFEGDKWVDTKPINSKSFHTLGSIDNSLYNSLIYWSLNIFTSQNILYLYITTLFFMFISNFIPLFGGVLEDIIIETTTINSETDTASLINDYQFTEEVKPKKNTLFEGIVSKFTDKERLQVEYPKIESIKSRTYEYNNILNKINTHYIDELDRENLYLKDKMSLMEVQLQRYRIIKMDWDRITDDILNDLSTHIEEYPRVVE